LGLCSSYGMINVNYNELLPKVVEKLGSGGLFLTSGTERPNTMVIGWGSVGIYWNKPVFIVPVRLSRFTHGLIEEAGEFTVSVPFGDMKAELAFCGTKSGRDVDKFRELNLTPVPGQKVKVPVIGECDLFYECKVIYKQTMNIDILEDVSRNRFYKSGDPHTMYYGEIIACYKK
jgi:flavin reductase (DIM6/NTAB) family NADH-FMN oxidoreductase RutF